MKRKNTNLSTWEPIPDRYSSALATRVFVKKKYWLEQNCSTYILTQGFKQRMKLGWTSLKHLQPTDDSELFGSRLKLRTATACCIQISVTIKTHVHYKWTNISKKCVKQIIHISLHYLVADTIALMEVDSKDSEVKRQIAVLWRKKLLNARISVFYN